MSKEFEAWREWAEMRSAIKWRAANDYCIANLHESDETRHANAERFAMKSADENPELQRLKQRWISLQNEADH